MCHSGLAGCLWDGGVCTPPWGVCARAAARAVGVYVCVVVVGQLQCDIRRRAFPARRGCSKQSALQRSERCGAGLRMRRRCCAVSWGQTSQTSRPGPFWAYHTKPPRSTITHRRPLLPSPPHIQSVNLEYGGAGMRTARRTVFALGPRAQQPGSACVSLFPCSDNEDSFLVT